MNDNRQKAVLLDLVKLRIQQRSRAKTTDAELIDQLAMLLRTDNLDAALAPYVIELADKLYTPTGDYAEDGRPLYIRRQL